MDETKIVNVTGKVRQQIRYHFSALATWFEIPKWFCDVSAGTLEGYRWNSRWLLPVHFGQFRFVVERIDMAAIASKVPAFPAPSSGPFGTIGM